jgi:hypothetical protein
MKVFISYVLKEKGLDTEYRNAVKETLHTKNMSEVAQDVIRRWDKAIESIYSYRKKCTIIFINAL